jgi:hypothetical protein
MALAHVTFICYYDYEVEVDDNLYDEDPWAAEEQAIEKAKKQYEALKCYPVADTTYDEVEVEFE